MINKPVHENELIMGMQRELNAHDQTNKPQLIKAAEHLHSALEIFENAGLTSQANEILFLLNKIAQKDKHISNLTPEKQVKNLKHHGTQFNMTDDNTASDLLDANITDESLEVEENSPDYMDFEDEK